METPLRRLIGVLVGLSLLGPTAVRGQDLADLDYDVLKFRGFGLEWGYLWPTRVDRTESLGLRLDMGYAGPGLRIVPNVTYWSSSLEQSEVTELATRIAGLVADQTGGPPPALDLGKIEWRDLAIGVDAHIVWDSPFDMLTYGGLGVAAHILDGRGDAINGTFIDDLLDSVTAGFNLHFGTEYPLNDRFRIYSLAKYEVLSDLQYFTVRVGWQIMTGPNAPGEGR
jgi:hypothetical protein